MTIPKPPKKKGRHKMTNACDISPKVRKKVEERDEGVCIVCGHNNGIANAHYIRRSRGGLGIEQNIGTLCPKCHHEYDNGGKEKEHGEVFKEYLINHYPDWNEEDLIYNKYGKMPISEKDFEYAMDKAAEIVKSDIR